MFTGLVEGVGELVGLTPMAGGLRLAVKTSFPATELTLGESVAVAGACLTVVALVAAGGQLRGVPRDPGLHDFLFEKGGGPGKLGKGRRDWATAWGAIWSPATWTASGWCGRSGPARPIPG